MSPARGYGTHDEDYEGLWEKRYRQEHDTVGKLEDELAAIRTKVNLIATKLDEIIMIFWMAEEDTVFAELKELREEI